MMIGTAMTTAMIPILPESAPFTPQQRSWLNGFFAGLFSGQAAPVNGNGHGVHATSAPALSGHAEGVAVAAEEDTPWHDPAMPMDERMKLAEARSFPLKLMAAMAQLDCGACGYLCKTYAAAIADGKEKDLTLCQPGGKATAVKLKELMKNRAAAQVATASDAGLSMSGPTLASPQRVAEGAPALSLSPGEGRGGQGNASSISAVPTAVVPSVAPTFTREHPFPAPLIANAKLNGAGSAKDTRFIALDIAGSGLKYEAGDSLGVWPENCFEHADAILRLLALSGAEVVELRDGRKLSLRQAMIGELDIAAPCPELFDLLLRVAGDKSDADHLRKLTDDQPVEGLIEQPHMIDVLARFPSARPTAQELATALRRIRPRLYSISSSPKAYPNEVHLTVGVVRYELDGRARKGVASSYLADRVLPRQPVRVFVNTSHFRPPQDSAAPMIMIGPGTGIAPFRAFLQDRQAAGAKGKNWLFFGDQRAGSDFLYRDEIEHFSATGLLTRLDTAFSRDGDAKVYVQHRMMEQSAELWPWLTGGASVYVCGDAKRMATDVDRTLHQIAQQHLGSAEAAKAFISDMTKAGRYQRDVY